MRGTLTSDSFAAPAEAAEFFEFAEARGWGDGLPLIPPTEARVQTLLETVDEAPETVIGVVEPRRGEATTEKIAVNAVMAGCPPACFPVVVAAVRAVCEPRFNLYALNTTTCCAAPALMINGPARRALDVQCGYSCLGNNGRANATIGRALRLVMRNVGGSIPGAVSKSTYGQPGRLSLCFGEWEERSPWEPFHVRRGFAADQNVVTAHCATGTQDIADIWADTGEELCILLAHSMDWIGNNKVLVPQADGEVLLLMCPDFADKMARDGLSMADVQRLLWEHTRTPLDRWPRGYWPKLEQRGYVEGGVVPLCARPDQFLVAVAGGDGGHHALYFCSFGLTWSVSVPFLLEPSSVAGEVCELPGRP